MKIKRTHDEIYLKKNILEEPKEMFKFVFKKAFNAKSIDRNEKILDVGCATGEFLYFLKNKTSIKNLYGSDVRNDLLNKAEKYIEEVKFLKRDVNKKKSFNRAYFDKIFMIGVHTIFDNFEKPFDNLISWTKKKGKIFICDMFNPYPVDVILRYKLSKDYKSSTYEVGWNNFSIESVTTFLRKNKRVKKFTFDQFHMPFDLKKNKKDLIRSWTFKDKNGKRIMTNGLSIIQNQILLSIEVK